MECTDKKCYIHGTLRVRGRTAVGKVVSAKAKATVVVERSIVQFFPKYKRWARGKSRILAHNPPCINAALGDIVKIGETRKISKRKAWTVMEVIKKADGAEVVES
jgi:small subunit ribosomal protein S17